MRRLVGVVVGLSILGCGGVADRMEEKAAEVAAEKLIESQGGGQVDLSEGRLSVTKDGVTAEIGSGAALPADWPAEILPPSGAATQGVTRSASPAVPGKFDFFAMFEGTGECAPVVEGFKGKLSGWKVQTETNFDTTTAVAWISQDGAVTVTMGCTKSDGKTSTTVSWNHSVVPTPG